MPSKLLNTKPIEKDFKNSKKFNEFEKYRLAREWANSTLVFDSEYFISFSEIHENYLNFLKKVVSEQYSELKKERQFQSNELGFFLKNYAAEKTNTPFLLYTSRSHHGMIYHGLQLITNTPM